MTLEVEDEAVAVTPVVMGEVDEVVAVAAEAVAVAAVAAEAVAVAAVTMTMTTTPPLRP